jgi:hypothetical protein
MKNLTPKEELEEFLFDLITVYGDVPEGSPYAEELYEEMVCVEGMLRSAEAMREKA